MTTQFQPADAHRVPAHDLLRLLPGMDQDLLTEVRRGLALHTQNSAPQATWQQAWNSYVGTRGALLLSPPRCTSCHGRGFNTRTVSRNLARTGHPAVCGDCRGSRRGTPYSQPARLAPEGNAP